MSDEQIGYECPICGVREITDDRMGHHLVKEHWDEIAEAFEEDQ